MAAGAAALVDHILPHVPVRQWVLSLPHALRYRLAWDHTLCRAVLRVYTRALLGFERRRGCGRGVVDGRSGTVTAIQRFGSGLQVNVHFHTLLLDGVFAIAPGGTTRFDPAPPPTDREVARLLAAIRTLDFTGPVSVLVGPNSQGKTSLAEALGMSRSLLNCSPEQRATAPVTVVYATSFFVST